MKAFFKSFISLQKMGLIASFLLFTACSQPQAKFHSVDITGATYAQDFSLPDIDGKTRTLNEFAGKVVIVFFGFTQCPDICPTTLAEINSVKQALNKANPGDGDKVQTLFISIDPERDTPPLLRAYVQNFDATTIALRPPTHEALARTAKAFKVYFQKVEGKTVGTYSMDHTAASYIFDPQGRVRLFARYGLGAPALTSDISQLLAGK